MTKVFIATPAFDGRVHVQFAVALAETYMLLASKGIESIMRIHSSGSLLVAERNRLLKSFLETDCTHMLCIDSDLGWPPQAVLAMLDHDLDFVGGCYPARGENIFLFRPVYKEDKSLVISEKKLIKMEYIPAGFLLIKRHVIEKMIADRPDLYFKPKDPLQAKEDGHYLFGIELMDGEFWGEDFVFCRRARESGFDIWADPLVEFDHAGTRGMLANCLTNDKEKSRGSICDVKNVQDLYPAYPRVL